MDEIYRSPHNRDVPPARRGEFPPLALGPIGVWPPVVLAPMAGVTSYPFRSLCRRFGAGLYVSEMISARPLTEGREKTLRLASFGPDETPRSLQLYGVDAPTVGEAVKRLVGEAKIDHLDMNFGCPAPKVTRLGGGAAIPLRPRLLASIVRAAVRNAGRVPVTIKFRIGIDDERKTFLEAGGIAEAEGCRGVGLHARTAADLYDGEADWSAIGELKARLGIPVMGNGDIWEAHDALRMMRTTGCDGVIVGRGCLGRPWLFRDLDDVFNGCEPVNPPGFGEILDIMFGHASHLVSWFGDDAVRSFRRQLTWYTRGFTLSHEVRVGMMQAETLPHLRAVFEGVDQSQAFPPRAMRAKRGKGSGRQKVALPETFRDEATPEVLVSGG
jgi:nifR3 family TIM-barrel protein